MAAAGTFRMSVSAGIATVVAVILVHGVFDVDDTHARVTGTDLLRYFWHGCSSLASEVVVMSKEVFDHDLEDALDAKVRHRVEYLLAAALGFQDPRGPKQPQVMAGQRWRYPYALCDLARRFFLFHTSYDN